jgi:CRP-like cAMP-binding protein
VSHLPSRFDGPVRTSFLGCVNSAIVDQILKHAPIWEVVSGAVFVGGSRGHRTGLVTSGLARVYTVRNDGSQETQRRVSTGSAVGIHAVVGRRNGIHAQAITDVEFVELDPELIRRLARQDSTLAFALAEEIDRRLADTERQLENSGRRVIQKVAAALLDMSIDGLPLEVRISQETLAETVGASRERVGHELHVLVRDGLITASRGRVLIVDPSRLEARAVGHSTLHDG